METLKLITDYLVNTANLNGSDKIDIEDELEPKDKMKEDYQEHFEWLRDEKNVNPLLAFQVLYHRMKEIASIAKEVFYDDAVEYAQKHDPDAEGKYFGSKVSLRTKEDWEVIRSPKILKLEKEKDKLEEKHKSAIKAYESYQTDVKSLDNQIKEEEKRLIEKGMAKKKGEKVTLVLKY